MVTNKRIILCKPKNLSLSMEFIDYDDITASFVKEGILGADFTFSTKSDYYLPKNQARRLYTYIKEQLDLLKNSVAFSSSIVEEIKPVDAEPEAVEEMVKEIAAEEVTNFAEIMPATTYTFCEEPKG